MDMLLNILLEGAWILWSLAHDKTLKKNHETMKKNGRKN